MSTRDENLTAPRPPPTIPYTIPLLQYWYITLVIGQNSWVKSHTQSVTTKRNRTHYYQNEPSAYTTATTTDCRLTCNDRSVPHTAAIYRENWTSANELVICCTSYYSPRGKWVGRGGNLEPEATSLDLSKLALLILHNRWHECIQPFIP